MIDIVQFSFFPKFHISVKATGKMSVLISLICFRSIHQFCANDGLSQSLRAVGNARNGS